MEESRQAHNLNVTMWISNGKQGNCIHTKGRPSRFAYFISKEKYNDPDYTIYQITHLPGIP